MQKLYETKIVFEVTLHHWQTRSPEQIIESAKALMTQYPKMVPSVIVKEFLGTKEIPVDEQ